MRGGKWWRRSDVPSIYARNDRCTWLYQKGGGWGTNLRAGHTLLRIPVHASYLQISKRVVRLKHARSVTWSKHAAAGKGLQVHCWFGVSPWIATDVSHTHTHMATNACTHTHTHARTQHTHTHSNTHTQTWPQTHAHPMRYMQCMIMPTSPGLHGARNPIPSRRRRRRESYNRLLLLLLRPPRPFSELATHAPSRWTNSATKQRILAPLGAGAKRIPPQHCIPPVSHQPPPYPIPLSFSFSLSCHTASLS